MAFSCNTNKEPIEINDYFTKLISVEQPIAIIDFTKNDSQLVMDIEEQLNTDLCNNQDFTAETFINNTKIQYPVYFFKTCEYFPRVHGILEILIKGKDGTLINDELISANSDITRKVFEETQEMMKGRTRLLYAFEWDKKSNPQHTRIKLYQTLKGIKKYSDSLSFLNYNMSTNNLNENQFDSLKEKFNMKFIFTDNFGQPTPPPTIEIKDIDNALLMKDIEHEWIGLRKIKTASNNLYKK